MTPQFPPSAPVNRVRSDRVLPAEGFHDVLVKSRVRGNRRKKMHSSLSDEEKDLPDEAVAWAFKQKQDSEPSGRGRRRRSRQPEVDFDDTLDPIFLANSERRMPEVTGDLRSFFPFQRLDPEVMPNLVAEELEYLAIKILEKAGHEIFGAGNGRYVELTSQVLKTLGKPSG